MSKEDVIKLDEAILKFAKLAFQIIKEEEE